MSIIAKYKFDKSIYADLLPEFNTEFTSDKYNTTDEEVDGIITRTIESDSLPTLMRFGRLWVSGESASDNRTDSLLEVLEMNTSGLTSCHSMFRRCKNLTSINCEWDTNNVTDMDSIFNSCTNLTSLDVSNFNTSNVTSMYSMFNSCTNLTSLDVSNWDTGNVTLMGYMFYNCYNLTSLDVSNFDTSKVTNMSCMFNYCKSLTSLDVSNFDTSKVIRMDGMFSATDKLISLDISNFSISDTTKTDYILTNTPLLTDIGMLYCNQSTINKIASLLPTDITQAIWIEDVDIKDLTPVEGVEFKQYAKNTEIMLTSPLLEGDKLIVKDGKLYHYHKMCMVVLDGSEDEGWVEYAQYISTNVYKAYSPLLKNKVEKSTYNHGISDKLPSVNISSLVQVSIDVEGISITGHDASIVIGLNKSALPSIDLNGFKQWLQANPTTVVYELASPYYEVISENPLDTSIISETVDITNSSNIPLNMTINNKGLSTIAMSPSTTYTVAFDKDTDSEVVVNLCGNEVTTTDNVVEITTPSEIDDELIFYGDGVEVSNVRLLEGSVSGDSVPRESFEGLKNSFEDGYIPENVLDTSNILLLSTDNFEATFENNTLEYKSSESYTDIMHPSNIMTFPGLVDGETYTLVFNSNVDCDVTLFGSNYELSYDAVGESTPVNKGFNALKFTLWEGYTNYGFRILTNPDNCRDFVFSNFNILEGDWTHLTLTEEDWNNLGKYKVEYKVTGKNKFDLDVFKSMDGWIKSTYDYYELRLKPNTTYVISQNTGKTSSSGIGFCNISTTTIYSEFATDNNFTIWLIHDIRDKLSQTITTDNSGILYLNIYGYLENFENIHEEIYNLLLPKNIQIEEGSVATPYEPYKSYTKTFYLNSPLLKGDTIEDVSGVATHVKRYDKVVLDGSENWKVTIKGDNEAYFFTPEKVGKMLGDVSLANPVYSDSLITRSDNPTNTNLFYNSVYAAYDGNICMIYNNLGTSGIKQWLSENPITVVYQLDSPIYEPISTESILCNSYVNGHLDFDTNIPIEKVQFEHNLLSLKYTNNQSYAVQFEADNDGFIDYCIIEQGGNKPNIQVRKGINKFTANGGNTEHPCIYISGIGFNASNIQVVATDRDIDFGYFKGLQSSFEDNNVKNLWDGTLVKGAYISSTEYTYGKDISETRSACIKCKPNTTYVITATNNNRLRIGHVSELVEGIVCMAYDVDDTNISYKEFTTTNREGYLVAYVANESNTNENITVDIREKTNEVKCKVVGKNKFDKSNVVLGYWGTDSTTYHTNIPSVFSHKTPIKVKPNTWYTMQSLGVAGNVYVVGLHPFESILVVNNSIASFYTNNRTEVYIQINAENTDLSKFLDIIQLEEGTQATSYEPYQEYTKTIYLNSPLLKGDTLEVHNGKLCHYHKMGMVVLDGSEDEEWVLAKNDGNQILTSKFVLNNLRDLPNSTKNIFSDKFRTANSSLDFNQNDTELIYGISIINLRIMNSKLSTLNENGFRQWLQQNPTTVVYELALPYYEEITPIQEDLIITSVKEGDLHIDTIVPISSKVTYNVNVQLLTDFEQSIVEQVQATQTTDLQSILDEEIDN